MYQRILKFVDTKYVINFLLIICLTLSNTYKISLFHKRELSKLELLVILSIIVPFLLNIIIIRNHCINRMILSKRLQC